MKNFKTMLTASALALVLASGTAAFAETPKATDAKKAAKHEHKEGDHAHKDDGKHTGHQEGDDHHDDTNEKEEKPKEQAPSR